MAYSCAVPPTSTAPPLASGETAVRELTLRAFILGAFLAIILGAANAYLGLYAGMTVSASIPAAVISMAVLRLLGGSTILENNVVQTIASAGEAVAAGAIFTFPALVILGQTGPLPYWDVTMLCLAGGTMGNLLVVFLRRAYIVDEHLPFPEGVACAEVLRSGTSGSSSAAPLAWGGMISAALKASQDILGFVPGTLAGARWVGRAALAGSVNLSAALVGVGYIVGLRIASLVFLGGAIGWLIAIPIASASHPELRVMAAADAAHQIWSTQTRYLGVGAMLVGGVVTLWRLRGPIGRGLIESARMLHDRNDAVGTRREDRDISAAAVLGAVALCIPAVFLISYHLSTQFLAELGTRDRLGGNRFLRHRYRWLSYRHRRRVEQSGLWRDDYRAARDRTDSRTARRFGRRGTAPRDHGRCRRLHRRRDGGGFAS
jgi:putative OPT family oligopeptide transporter